MTRLLLTNTEGAYLLFIWITLGCGTGQCKRVSHVGDARTDLLQAIPILLPEDSTVVAETPLMYLGGRHIKTRPSIQARFTHNFLLEIRESHIAGKFPIKE